jgi:hypothetical protein
MRLLFALVLMTLAIAGLVPVSAADLVEPNSDGGLSDGAPVEGVSYDGAWTHGVRAMPAVIFDYEPGVNVRAYWRSPWRHRHYFPVAGKQPVVGRLEDLSVTGSALQPAENYYRSWSTTALFAHDAPRKRAHARALDDEGVPRRGGKFPQAPANP